MNVAIPEWQPAQGPARPLERTHPRVPGSVRRTTSIDCPWPGATAPTAELVVRGRDLRTTAGGSAIVEASLDLHIEVDRRSGRVVTVLGSATSPWDAIVGASVRSGFGRSLPELFPSAADDRPLAYSALDDLPGALLVSGYAMVRTGSFPADPSTGVERAARQADVCVGWRAGSPVHSVLLELGTSAIPYGPVAPQLQLDDPDGWHDLPAMATHTVRRRRVVDVQPVEGGLEVRSHFRDSYAAEDHEMVMHEYLVTAGVDPSMCLEHVAVEPLVLPWAECPAAVASAQGLVGTPLAELDMAVRRSLVRADGCTHLSSTLRALADVAGLAALLIGRRTRLPSDPDLR